MKRFFLLPLAALLVLGACTDSRTCSIELPTFITDSMVVQQNSVLKIAGTAAGNVTAKASWSADSYSADLVDGAFMLEIPTPEAGGPYTITISDGNGADKKLNDIYSGEVWLCSGQSNMEMPVKGWGKVMNYEAEIDTAINFPLIRFLQVTKRIATSPRQDEVVNMGGWRPCSPATVENFSAIAYFFARDLQRELDGIPVGVIDCTWGGTPAEAWTSLGGVEKVGSMEFRLDEVERFRVDSIGEMAKYEQRRAEFYNNLTSLKGEFDVNTFNPNLPDIPTPGEWEQSVLPGFDGMVWYQTTVEIPESMAGKELTLSLGAIDDTDNTYFNGVEIGHLDAWDAPRKYTVADSLATAGTAVISICVLDTGNGGGLHGKAEELFLSDGTDTINLAGNWKYSVVKPLSEIGQAPNLSLNSNSPTVLYNAMLYPLRDLSVAGVIWYQGCNNVGRAEQYSRLFPQMINDWRALFNDDDMPFNFVQLAGYLEPKTIQPDSEWAALRAAQEAALQLENVGMATAIDIGDPYDIHPKNKQEVARRLSLIALNRNYGKDVNYTAPKAAEVKFAGNTAVITFDKEIVAKGEPAGFIVKTASGWLTPATAITADNAITLTAPSTITALKYDWADCPNGNIYGTDNLPVTPFER